MKNFLRIEVSEIKNKILISITIIAIIAFFVGVFTTGHMDGSVNVPSVAMMSVSGLWLMLFTMANEKSA